MAMKLSTTLGHIGDILNPVNASLVKDFYHYLKEIGTSENYQNQNIKQLIGFAKFLGTKTFHDVKTKNEIVSFLDTKMKDTNTDPDKKWITTWNDYLWRIKYIFRWLYNYRIVKENGEEPANSSDWITPPFVSISKKRTKRISPYLEAELWEKEDLLCIIKYEHHKRNKAILSLLWDLDARPHEVTLLKIKHVRLKEKYLDGRKGCPKVNKRIEVYEKLINMLPEGILSTEDISNTNFKDLSSSFQIGISIAEA